MVAISLLALDYDYGPVTDLAGDVAADLRRAPGGGLELPATSDVAARARSDPRLWAVARDPTGAQAVLGRPPDAALRLAAATPVALSDASALNFELEGTGPGRRARLDSPRYGRRER
jgi:hypothetical protein